MTIHKRIRQKALAKVSVRITGRVRCRNGFTVIEPDGSTRHCLTKAEALAWLLARVRCHPEVRWAIVPGRKEVDSPCQE